MNFECDRKRKHIFGYAFFFLLLAASKMITFDYWRCASIRCFCARIPLPPPPEQFPSCHEYRSKYWCLTSHHRQPALDLLKNASLLNRKRSQPEKASIARAYASNSITIPSLRASEKKSYVFAVFTLHDDDRRTDENTQKSESDKKYELRVI